VAVSAKCLNETINNPKVGLFAALFIVIRAAMLMRALGGAEIKDAFQVTPIIFSKNISKCLHHDLGVSKSYQQNS
jgi:hypothetical protein